MAKIKLGARPKNFKKTITVPLPEGGEGKVEASYIYRTRTEFGTFIDELFKAAGVAPKSQADEDVTFSLREALEKTRDTNADYLMKIMDGWNLDEEFSRSTVVQLCDELPGAALALIEHYRAAITEGRLGN
jgi:hypothetical protein